MRICKRRIELDRLFESLDRAVGNVHAAQQVPDVDVGFRTFRVDCEARLVAAIASSLRPRLSNASAMLNIGSADAGSARAARL